MNKNILRFVTITIIILMSAGLKLNSIHAENVRDKAVNISRINYADTLDSNKYLTYDNNVPDEYILFQNYPNPFNPTTVIKYSLPEENHITIKVFNSLGNEVKTLVDETQPAGYHKVVFNGNNFTSGVYYTQLKADGFVKVIKMILLK